MTSPEQFSDRVEISEDEAKNGRWVVPAVSYVDPVRRFCAMTGRPIARGYWQVVVAGREVAFSDREHAIRYATYPISPIQESSDEQSKSS